jgi:hypothetical protein
MTKEGRKTIKRLEKNAEKNDFETPRPKDFDIDEKGDLIQNTILNDDLYISDS